MAKTKIKFLQKPTCTTCRKAKDYLEKLGAELELRSLDAEPLSEAELDQSYWRSRLQTLSEPAKRALSHEKYEGESAIESGGHQIHGQSA